jgi:hypothetical protein
MKRALLAAAALAWMACGHAAERIPSHLTGMWSTAESLYAGTTGQSEMYLLEDGRGAFGASSPPRAAGVPAPGKDDANARVILGFAFRAVEGDVLILQPVVKGGGGEQPPPVKLLYRNAADGPTLVSPDKAIPGEALKRRSDSVPEQIATMIRDYLAEPGAPTPAPATPP